MLASSENHFVMQKQLEDSIREHLIGADIRSELSTGEGFFLDLRLDGRLVIIEYTRNKRFAVRDITASESKSQHSPDFTVETVDEVITRIVALFKK